MAKRYVLLQPNMTTKRFTADLDHFPGEYLVAWHPKASEKNERSEVGLRHPSGVPILFKQIAGAVARRIVCYAREGEAYDSGASFGTLRFAPFLKWVSRPMVMVLKSPI
jgi:phosphatidylserine decarboxylase